MHFLTPLSQGFSSPSHQSKHFCSCILSLHLSSSDLNIFQGTSATERDGHLHVLLSPVLLSFHPRTQPSSRCWQRGVARSSIKSDPLLFILPSHCCHSPGPTASVIQLVLLKWDGALLDCSPGGPCTRSSLPCSCYLHPHSHQLPPTAMPAQRTPSQTFMGIRG